MAGSTISSTITTGVTLGVGYYASPLTITATGEGRFVRKDRQAIPCDTDVGVTDNQILVGARWCSAGSGAHRNQHSRQRDVRARRDGLALTRLRGFACLQRHFRADVER